MSCCGRAPAAVVDRSSFVIVDEQRAAPGPRGRGGGGLERVTRLLASGSSKKGKHRGGAGAVAATICATCNTHTHRSRTPVGAAGVSRGAARAAVTAVVPCAATRSSSRLGGGGGGGVWARMRCLGADGFIQIYPDAVYGHALRFVQARTSTAGSCVLRPSSVWRLRDWLRINRCSFERIRAPSPALLVASVVAS